MQTASLENRAGFWVRFAAFLMDRLILWVLLLFVLTGAYPVPFMGFGLSPIAGYYLAHACCSVSPLS